MTSRLLYNLKGPRGYSAYELAVANGFIGTVDQWLLSLKGPKGDPGTGEGSLIEGPPGDKGDRGDPGAPGPAGPPSVIVLDPEDPDPSPPLDGVLYVRLSSAADTTAPSVPTGLTAGAVTTSSFTVSWSASTDAVGVIGYEARIDSGAGVAAISPHTFSGRAPGTAYSVQVRARDAAANWSDWSSPLTVTTEAAPSGPSLMFSDTFNRANGPALNGWQGPSGDDSNTTIVSNTLAFSGWSGYNRAWQSGRPRLLSVRAVFPSTIDWWQGIFLARHPVTGGGIRLFRNDSGWVLGNADSFFGENSVVAGTPPEGTTALRLDFDGVNVRAWAGIGAPTILVGDVTLTSLGITGVSSDPADTYLVGYCGEAKAPNMDSFEIWSI